ncbi:MAG: WbqC family protein [Muribaculaceae bacterium]|nr:WbqC family protein [Muribaculaceae bacterium]
MPNGSPLILPTLFCPTPSYYRAIVRHQGQVIIDTATRFDKRRKQTHRCLLADARGPIELTVPIAKPYGPTWDKVEISRHGEWWITARTLLESAYGRTPFYEFYADDFMPLLNPEDFTTVADMNRRFDETIRRCLHIQADVTYQALNSADTREPGQEDVGPYWQVRADKFGYISGLSVLDLLFNLGPEAIYRLL